jgi:hypothetical protein
VARRAVWIDLIHPIYGGELLALRWGRQKAWSGFTLAAGNGPPSVKTGIAPLLSRQIRQKTRNPRGLKSSARNRWAISALLGCPDPRFLARTGEIA